MQLSSITPFAALLGIWFAFPLSVFAQGDLFLSPTRVVFEGSDRTQEVLVVNTGQDSAIFTVSFMEYHIDESGNYHPIREPEAAGFYASRFVRFFPRKFALAPNASQTLRLQYLPKPDMPGGEYRSHLFFRMDASDQQRASTPEGSGDQPLSIRLNPVYGVTIPVLVREGNLSSETEITDIRLNFDHSPAPLLEFAIRRYGDKSTSGDLTVDVVTADQRVINLLTQKGISLYTSSGMRKFALPLDLASGHDLRQGTLLIRYGAREQAGEAISRLPLRIP